MRRLKKVARWIGLGATLLVVAIFVIRNWVVQAVILHEVRQQYGGKVVVGDWWLNWNSAGVRGIKLGETDKSDSPNWLTAERISTDVSLSRLLRGQVMPTRIEVDHPKLALRFDPKGQLATPLPFKVAKGGGGTSAAPTMALPEVVVDGAEVTVAQEGRPALTIQKADVRMSPDSAGSKIEATANDPIWGRVKVTGQFESGFKNGTINILSDPNFVVQNEQLKKIPFVPTEVWANLEANGPVDASVKITLKSDDPKPVHVLTHLNLKGASVKLDTLQVETTDTTGEITIDDAKVQVNHLRGKAVNGTLSAAGTLDFSQNPPDLSVDLRLRGIDVTKAPAAWQLGELGATGTLTGKVDLRALLDPDGIDLTGTSGRAVIEDGSFQGIPIKALSVNMKANGKDLQFETLPENQKVDKTALETAPTVPNVPRRPVAANDREKRPKNPGGKPESAKESSPLDSFVEPLLSAIPLIRIITGDEGFLGFASFAVSELVEHRTNAKTTPPGSKLRLPKTITTRIELEDVDLKTILDKAAKFGIKLDFPISGRFSVKATTTIPLGSLRDLKGYAVHGDASLSKASIANVDLGELAAHLDVEDGVVNLSDFRGVLVDRPNGEIASRRQAVAAPPRTGELPSGGFRANLRAEISPRGMATAKIEGKRLPLGELFAPVLPVPTPLSGDLTIHVDAGVNLASLANPKAYRLEGNFESRRIAYQGAMLDRVASRFEIKDGHASIPEFAAQLAGKPLSARAGLDLAPPYAFHGSGNVAGWEIADVLAFVPNLPKKPAIAGRLDANADANGTLFPFSIETVGGARVAAIKVGAILSKYLVFEWKTERDVIALNGLETAIFGGKITGDAKIPTKPGKKLDVNLALKGIDTREMTSALPSKSVAISGVADGRVKLTMPLDASSIDAEANLNAPELVFRPEGRFGEGIKVESLRIVAKGREDLATYQVSADSLGGKLLFTGSMPLKPTPTKAVATAEAKVVGFRLGDAWRGLGMSGGLAELDGQGAVNANLRAMIDPPQLWSRGLFELRELKYGHHLVIGDLRGQASVSPTSWKLEQVEGTLFGGVAGGGASGVLRSGALGQSSFDFRIDRASVPKLLASVPALARGASGYGSLRAAGRLDESLHLTAEVDIPQTLLHGMTLTDVRMPVDINVSPTSGVGLAQARRWTARLAGGQVQGNSWMRLGGDKAFQSDIRLTGVDLEFLSRIGAISSKASSGKLSGNLSLNGPNPEEISKLRGRFTFDLDDASLVSLPIFRELDRFLGASKGGGLFEDGDLSGNIANQTIYIEQMTLNGRLVQVHALGSITFGGGLNLEVLVNTNQIIPQSGLALINIIPGLGEALGQSEKILMKLASFLENRLLKFRVTGNVKNPTVTLDPSVDVGGSAVGFFSNILKVPGGSN